MVSDFQHRCFSALRYLVGAAIQAGLILTMMGAVQANAEPPAKGLKLSLSRPKLETAYGDYLVSRIAGLSSDNRQSALALMRASERDEDNALMGKAYFGAIINGELDWAHDHAPDETSGPLALLMKRTLELAVAMKSDQPKASQIALDQVLALNPEDRFALLVQPIIWAKNGRWDEAGLFTPKVVRNNGPLNLFVRLEQAQILEIHERYTEAENAYRQLASQGSAQGLFLKAYAEFLDRRGRSQDAIDTYAKAIDIAAEPTLFDRVQRIKNKIKPEPLTLGRLQARAGFAASLLFSVQGEKEYAMVNAQLGAWLDPEPKGDDFTTTQYIIGNLYNALGDRNEAKARWLSIPAASPMFSEARMQLAQQLISTGNFQDAAMHLEAVTHGLPEPGLTPTILRDDRPDRLRLSLLRADIKRNLGDTKGALTLIKAHIKAYGEGDLSWEGWYMLAGLYDSQDQWLEAEKAINMARKLGGDRAEILNFLGYGWINRRQHISDGLELVKQALKLAPKNGAITDSLGWAYYQLGQFPESRDWLEKAVVMEPSNPEITEHLGDVYLALHRTNEAQFEWRRAMSLNPSPSITQRLDSKLSQFASKPQVAAKP